MTVAESYLLACWVNRDTGFPDLGAQRVKHVVRVGPNPRMPVVLEFASGGVLAHVACAPASIQSRLIEGGIDTTVIAIERLAGTNSNGTGFPGCERALEHFGVKASLSGSCPAGYVMNPMLDQVVDVATFRQYEAARQGGLDVLIMAGTTPVQPPPEDDDLTPEESQMLKDIHTAMFEPVEQLGGEGYPTYATPNTLDIIRRKVSPYKEGYPPANPVAPVAPPAP